RRCRSVTTWTTTTTWTTAFWAISTWTTVTTIFWSCCLYGHFAVRKHIAFINPNFDTDNTVSGMCFGCSVIDVCTQCMQRHTAFAIPFATSNLDTVQTTCAHDFDTLSTKTHGVLHRTFHCTTELNTLFQLLSNGVSNQLSISFRFTNFFDIDVYRYAHQTLKINFQVLDVFTTLTNYYARTSGVNSDACVFVRTLNNSATNRSVLELFLELFAYADIVSPHTSELVVVCMPT